MRGLNELSTNIATQEEKKAKVSSRWGKMKRLPAPKSRRSARWEPSRSAIGRRMVSEAIIAAEKTKLAASSQKQAFSERHTTRGPAVAGANSGTRLKAGARSA